MKQLEHYFIGSIKSQAQRGVFYFSIYNFAQILFLSFESGAYGGLFPNFWIYLAAHAVGFALIVLFDYAFVLPGEKAFQNGQSYDRDPLRGDHEHLEDRLDDLEEKIDDIDDRAEAGDRP